MHFFTVTIQKIFLLKRKLIKKLSLTEGRFPEFFGKEQFDLLQILG